jgi:hypothetical protein
VLGEAGFNSTPATRVGRRILEKQDRLQMSPVFSCMRTLIIRWFCFSRILVLQNHPVRFLDFSHPDITALKRGALDVML